jgi:anti-sigma factor RsiW
MSREQCPKVSENLSAFLDGELSVQERQHVEGHLRLCNSCKKEYHRLTEAIAIMREWHGISPSETFDRQFQKRLQKQRRRLRRGRGRIPAFIQHVAAPYRLALATAISLLLIVFGGLLLIPKPTHLNPYEIGLAQNLDLFQNFGVIQYRDGLENFDLINAMDELHEAT